MPKIKNENLFLVFTRFPALPSEKGRKQFFENQSYGVVPSEPTSYYKCLIDGKEVFDMQCSEMQKMYQKGEWWGWHQLWKDFKGYRWIIPHLCKWHKNIPDWVSVDVRERETI